MTIEYLEEVDSTNVYIKQYLPTAKDRIVCAKRQTGGKGTKGRSFLSHEGGLYLSVLRFYNDFFAKDAFQIMAHAAVSVCKTAADFGVKAQIKWPNDVLVEDKKLCGILIENVLKGEKIEASIVGIGVNVNNDLTGLNDIAIRLCDVASCELTVENVRDHLIAHLQEEIYFNEYVSYIGFLNRQVLVIEGEKKQLAVVRSVREDGNLEVEMSNGMKILSAAEISLRLDV